MLLIPFLSIHISQTAFFQFDPTKWGCRWLEDEWRHFICCASNCLINFFPFGTVATCRNGLFPVVNQISFEWQAIHYKIHFLPIILNEAKQLPLPVALFQPLHCGTWQCVLGLLLAWLIWHVGIQQSQYSIVFWKSRTVLDSPSQKTETYFILFYFLAWCLL